MKVLLVDIDSKIPNLALMKISTYHKNKGDLVGFNIQDPELVYVSCIFDKNREQALGLKKFYPNSKIIFGGSGINYNTLPDEIPSSPVFRYINMYLNYGYDLIELPEIENPNLIKILCKNMPKIIKAFKEEKARIDQIDR